MYGMKVPKFTDLEETMRAASAAEFAYTAYIAKQSLKNSTTETTTINRTEEQTVNDSQKLPDNLGVVHVNGPNEVMTTEFPGGTTVTVRMAPRDIHALEYKHEFHPDGRMLQYGDTVTGETQTVKMTAGAMYEVGQWRWAAGPHALVGVRSDR